MRRALSRFTVRLTLVVARNGIRDGILAADHLGDELAGIAAILREVGTHAQYRTAPRV